MIRRATSDDAEAVATVFRAAFGTLTFLPTLHTPEEDREHFGRVIAGQEVWVYEEEGRVLGFVALGAELLHYIYVEPDACGRGIGSRLLAHAKQRRPNGLRLWTFQRNEGAKRFYDRHGFRVVELTDGSGNEEHEPDLLYEWLPPTRAHMSSASTGQPGRTHGQARAS